MSIFGGVIAVLGALGLVGGFLQHRKGKERNTVPFRSPGEIALGGTLRRRDPPACPPRINLVVFVVSGLLALSVACSAGSPSGTEGSDGMDGGAGSSGSSSSSDSSSGGGGGGSSAGGGTGGTSSGTGADGGSTGMDGGAAQACPCALGFYCHLPTQACKAGCVAAGGCPHGQYCDVDNRTCRPGCENDPSCGPKQICDNHVCSVGCRTCPDDGNPCTKESCDQGSCVSTPMADGDTCGNFKACVKGVCKGESAYCARSGMSSPWTYNDLANPANSGSVNTCQCSPGADAIITDGTVRKSCAVCKSFTKSVQCF